MKTGVFSHQQHDHRMETAKTFNFFFALIALMFFSLSSTAQVVASQEIDKALYLSNTEQTKKAVELLHKATQANPTDAQALYYLGYVQIKAGETDNALKSFEKGIQINEKEPLNYAGKGYVRVLQNNPVETKTYFDKALLMTKSKNPLVLNAIAEAYLTNKQFVNQALELLQKSQSQAKDNPDTQILLGDTYVQLVKGGESISSYEKAASLDPKDATPHYKIGLVYMRSKNFPVAQEAFKKAITIDPGYTSAYKELGELYYGLKEGENAVKAQETYLSLTENPAAGKRQLAFYYFMAKNYTKANELFKELAKDPTAIAIMFRFWGVASMEVGDFEQAIGAFDQYFAKAKPEEIQASDYAADGKAKLKLKQDSLAIISFGKSLTLDSTQTEILQLQGETLYKKKKFPETIKVYKKLMSLRKKPLSADAYTIGRAYYYNNQLVEADSSFSQLVRLQPTMTVGHLWKARIKAVQDPDMTQGLAKSYFEKLIEIASTNPEKNKADLVEAYNFMAAYSYNIEHDKAKTISFYEKILVLKPDDKPTQENLEILKKGSK